MKSLLSLLIISSLSCSGQQGSPPPILIDPPQVVSHRMDENDSSNLVISILDSGLMVKHLKKISVFATQTELDEFITANKTIIDSTKILVIQHPSSKKNLELHGVLRKHSFFKFRMMTFDEIEKLPQLSDKDYDAIGLFLWEKHVPRSGPAKNVQGELLRAIEKLADEAQRNGNINFGSHCHTHLIAFLKKYLTDPLTFDEATIILIKKDLQAISIADSPYLEDDLYERLRHRIIDWYLKHIIPTAFTPNTKLKC